MNKFWEKMFFMGLGGFFIGVYASDRDLVFSDKFGHVSFWPETCQTLQSLEY